MATRSQTATPFFTVTRLPIDAPDSMKQCSPMLQSEPTTAPRMTCANAQIRVRGPTSSLSQRPLSWTKTLGSSGTSAERFPERLRDALLVPHCDLRKDRQGQNLLRAPNRHGIFRGLGLELSEGFLQVNGNGIVDARADSGGVQLAKHPVALSHANDVEVPDVHVSRQHG